MRTKLPAIGITLDAENAGGYSKMPWYALRQNYFEAVQVAGGLPLALPHHAELAAPYADLLQGLVVTGGAFDIDPAMYGEQAHPSVLQKPTRTQFEVAITQEMLARNKPVLGICGGQQLLAVLLGGTLIQHIPDSIAAALPHEQPNPRTQAGHTVAIAPNTLLHRIVSSLELPVNSAHHQAVKTVGAGCVVNATAPDGVIEGIEHAGYAFCLGVQWHPEYHISEGDKAIFQALVNAAA
jgi:putative glutamine amidotransferase